MDFICIRVSAFINVPVEHIKTVVNAFKVVIILAKLVNLVELFVQVAKMMQIYYIKVSAYKLVHKELFNR